MKSVKTTLIALCLLCATHQQGQAQIIMSLLFGDALNTDELYFGLHLDYAFNTLSNTGADASLNKLNAGLFFNYRFSDRLYGQGELLPIVTMGARDLSPYSLNDSLLNSQFAEGNVERNLNYVGLSTMLEYRVYNYIRVGFGPHVFLRTKAQDLFTADNEQGDLSLVRDIKSETNTFYAGLNFGASWQLGKGTGMFLGLRYALGLTDMLKEDDFQSNRNLAITANIPIGRAKLKETTTE